MEMQFKNEIKKLADIVVWADGKIRDGGYYEEKYRSDATTAYCNVKAYELWKIRDVVLKGMERHTVYTNALNKDIAEKAAKIDLLEKELEGRKEGYVALKKRMDTKYISIEEHNNICKTYEDKIQELEKQNEYLAKELDQTCTCKELDLKGHQSRETALVNALADKNDEIKDLKGTIEYYKDQERIRTNQLRATESKVEELHGSINRLTLNCRSKNTEIARLTKEMADIRHELAKRTAELEFNEEDDYGRAGFKRYIEHLIEEEERAVPERFKARLNEEITTIFKKEEETEVKGNGRTSSGRYPWGAKVNDIPCGEDSIE